MLIQVCKVLTIILTCTLLLIACGSDSDSDTDTQGGNDTFTLSVSTTGDGSVSSFTSEVRAGQSLNFVVTPDERMVTESISSDSCDLDVVGDMVFIDNVQSDCNIEVAFDTCLGCYNKDDAVLDYQPAAELLARSCVRGGLVATGSDDVSWHNLCQAAEMLETMLSQNSVVTSQMQQVGAITALFGPNEGVCDLPYFSFLEGKPQCTEVLGGLGGVPGNPVTACNARTLSAVNDPFNRGRRGGENTCVHELAHTIMNVGVSAELNREIYARYDEVDEDGELWFRANGEPSFALFNGDEFFAELAQSYFNANVAIDAFNHTGINGADELLEYDPISFELIDRIFMKPADLR